MSERRGCFKTGCLGCLGVGGAVVLILVVLVVLGLATGGRPGNKVSVERAHDLPPTAGPSPWPPDAEPPEILDREIGVAEPGRVVLDLNRGSFRITPGPPGSALRVEGRYDEGRYELVETLEGYGAAGWVYRVSFDERGFGLRPLVMHADDRNELHLILPRGVPIVLQGRVGMGESELELGGLWLVEVDLHLGIGVHAVSFDEPLPVPMGRLRLDTSIGELHVAGVGHASPQDVWIKHSVGQTRIDLDGAWRRDAEALVSCGIGQCDVRLPRTIHVELDSVRVSVGQARGPHRDTAPAAGTPTLELSVSGSIGDVNVR